MDDPLDAGGMFRDVERSTVNRRLAGCAFHVVPLAAVVGADLPGRVVGRRSDDTNLMSTERQPSCHLPRVLTDAGKLGGVVQPVDQDSQAGPFVAAGPRAVSL